MEPARARVGSGTAASGRRFPLLSLDPDLGSGLPPAICNLLHQTALVAVMPFAVGEWKPPVPAVGPPSPLLVIEGLLVREVCIAGRYSAELFGAGDIIQPSEADDGSATPSPRWAVLSAGRVALLDDRLLAEAG